MAVSENAQKLRDRSRPPPMYAIAQKSFWPSPTIKPWVIHKFIEISLILGSEKMTQEQTKYCDQTQQQHHKEAVKHYESGDNKTAHPIFI